MSSKHKWPFIYIAVTLILTGCGQNPSFVEGGLPTGKAKAADHAEDAVGANGVTGFDGQGDVLGNIGGTDGIGQSANQTPPPGSASSQAEESSTRDEADPSKDCSCEADQDTPDEMSREDDDEHHNGGDHVDDDGDGDIDEMAGEGERKSCPDKEDEEHSEETDDSEVDDEEAEEEGIRFTWSYRR